MRLVQDYLRSLGHERGLLRVGCRQGSCREGVQIDYDRDCVEDEIANSVHAPGSSVAARIRILQQFDKSMSFDNLCFCSATASMASGTAGGAGGAMFDVPKGVGERHWDDAELLPRAAGPPPL